MLLVQSIQITDKFGFEKQQGAKPKTPSSSETVFFAAEPTGFCVNGLGKFAFFICLYHFTIDLIQTDN